MNRQKIAFITGANRGLGLETARLLGESGVEVILGSRSRDSGEEAAASLRARGIKTDAIQFDALQEQDHIAVHGYLGSRYGRLDILVNNAGASFEGGASEVGPSNTTLLVGMDALRKSYDVNFFSVVSLTRRLLPLLQRSAGGRIVNVSSILGSLGLQVDPNQPLVSEFKFFGYGTSKTALNTFTIYLAHALRNTPVKVNSAHPGWVKTDVGGPNATLELSEGGKTSAALALLDEDGPTGGFFHFGESVPW
jgi:NAD(P)-dependent dehydrogenase (short-subunit alcohol dehydrogenase family)